MRVGVICDYGMSSRTRASLVVSEVLEELGHEVSLFALRHYGLRLGCRWDNLVREGFEHLQDWLDAQEGVISFNSMDCSVVGELQRAGKVVVGVLDSSQLSHFIAEEGCYSKVVCTSPGSAEFLFPYGSIACRVYKTAWWSGWSPIVRKTLEPIRDVVIPSFDRKASRWRRGWFGSVVDTLLSRQDVRITVLGGRNQLSPIDKQILRNLQKTEPRVRVVVDCSDASVCATYSEADLVCWGLPEDDYFWGVLAAQQSGCPVLFYDHPQTAWMRNFPLSLTSRFAENASYVENNAYYCDALHALLARTKPISLSESKLRDHYGKTEVQFRQLWADLFPAV